MIGRAPAGFYTLLDVSVTLANGSEWDFSWATQMGLIRAMHKAPAWVKASLTKEKIAGRSKIIGWKVHVRLRAGNFDQRKARER